VSEVRRFAVDLDDVRAAAHRIAGLVVRTPTVPSETLGAICGCEIRLKLENLQFTGSFKDRGAANRVAMLDADERAHGVIAMSAGNHAQALAHHATRAGVPATIVMPRATPNVKVANTERLGATVVLHGDDLAEAAAEAHRICAEQDMTWVSPYDDPYVIAGQGTCALELLEDAPEIDTLVVPCGGGGLIAGIATVVRALRPEIRVIGVQNDRYAAMMAAVRGVSVEVGGATIAEGIAVAHPGALTIPIVQALVHDLMTVDDAAIEQAMGLFVEVEKTVVEGAGAAGLAAVLADPMAFAGRCVGIIVCGGNVDSRILAQVLMRALVRSGRLTRVAVGIADTPGSLAKVSAIVAAEAGNIIEVAHQRLFADLTVTSAELEVMFETRNAEHAATVIAALQRQGFSVRKMA
jgi:threonine dehydratase